MRSLLALSLVSAVSAQTSIVLTPFADATTDSSQPTVNFGTSPELDFGKQFAYAPNFTVWFARGHVEFDPSPFVGIGVPTRATFHWYQSQSNAAGCLDVSLHRVTGGWSETTITWQNQPPYDPAEISRACVGDSFALGWKAFDVTSLVRSWLDGTVVDYSFVIKDPNESTAGAARPGLGHSREYANAALRPYLEIEFATSFGTGCTTHATQPFLAVAGGSAIMGETLELGLGQLEPGSLSVVFFGLGNTMWNATPLPLSLASIGYPNCELLVEPGVGVLAGIAPGTTATLPVVVPTSAAYSGLPLFAQAFAFTQAGSLEATNGLGFAVWLP